MSLTRSNSGSAFTAEIFKRLNQSQIDKKILATPQNLIDQKYITFLKDFVEKKYRELKRNGLNETTPATYGNLHIKVPFELTSYIYFHDHKKIYDNAARAHGINRAAAVASYINFMHQYNLATLQFLKAINNPDDVAELKRLFKPNVMLNQADIDLTYVSEVVKNPSFNLGMLAYIAFDIVFSADANITLAARSKTFAILKKEFDFAAVMAALDKFGKGFEYSIEDAEYIDRHPDIMHNIFQVDVPSISLPKEEMIAWQTLQTNLLIADHSDVAMQVLKDLFCRSSWTGRKFYKAIFFETLSIALSNPGPEAALMLDAFIRLRNDNCSEAGLMAWAVATTKISFIQNYVDVAHLAMLPDAKSRTILLSYAMHIFEMEMQVINSSKCHIDADDDPLGYFNALGMDPKTDPADFEKKLEMHYRVRSTLLDPEDVKHSKELNDVNLAFDVLKCPEKRADYLNGTTSEPQTNGSGYHQNGHGNGNGNGNGYTRRR